MTKEAWRKRQAQWKRFQKWEAAQQAIQLPASERLAEIGALVDRAQRRGFSPETVTTDLEALVSRVRALHIGLGVLDRAP